MNRTYLNARKFRNKVADPLNIDGNKRRDRLYFQPSEQNIIDQVDSLDSISQKAFCQIDGELDALEAQFVDTIVEDYLDR